MNYDSCVINDTSQKMKILNCSKPNSTTAHYYTLLVRDFQPIPGIPDFTEGQSYYFICEYSPRNVAVHCVYTITCTHCEYTNHRMWQFSVCTPSLVLMCTPSLVLTVSTLTTECDSSLCVHHHLYSLRSVSTLTAACDRWLMRTPVSVLTETVYSLTYKDHCMCQLTMWTLSLVLTILYLSEYTDHCMWQYTVTNIHWDLRVH